jgi:hypothetical protein
MSVNIPISASPAGAVDAIRSIEQAIQRAGQAGRAFRDLDLSHPELSGMSEDIRRLAGRFNDLSRIGRGSTAQAFRAVNRATGGGDPSDFLAWDSALERVFPDPTERARHRANVLGYATPGTRFAPSTPAQQAPGPAPGPMPGPSPAPPSPPSGGGGGGMLAGIGSSMMGFMGASLAMAGISTIKQVLSESIGKAQEEAGTTEDLYRHTDTTKSFLDLRDAVMASTHALGVNAQEAGRLSLTWARMTGEANPEAISRGVQMGVGMGRSYGMDPGVATQVLGQATIAGLDPAKFAILIGEAAGKGGRSADETTPALLRLTEAATRSLVTHSNELQTASMLAGLNAMGVPGLRGQNAEAVMSTLGTSISQGGNAGPASAALSYMVGRRQGVTDPYDLQMLQEGGLFASAKSDLGYGSDETNFSARLAELQRLYAGAPQNRLLNAMQNDLGVNMRQGRELLRYKPADLSTTFNALQGAKVDLKDMNPTAIADAVRIANAPPGQDVEAFLDNGSNQTTTKVGLNSIRQQMLGRHGQGELSPEDQAKLSGAGPGDLRNVLLQMTAKYGQSETDGSKTRESQAELSNAMTKLGRDLLPPLNDLKTGMGTLGGELADLGSVITDVYRAGKGDPEASDRLTFGKAGAGRGGGERPLSSAAQDETAQKLMEFYQSKEGGGYTREQAAGIVAQAGAESGYRAHGPAGDGGLAQGMFQWHPDRVAAIEAHFGKKLGDMDMMEQARAKSWELSPEGPEAEAGRALRRTTTAYGAGFSETVSDQRPSAKEMRGVARGSLASSIANMQSGPIATIAPLQIVHLDQYGNMLGNQELPVTTITPPTPWGPPRAGEASPTPPAPPKPALNMGQQFWGGAP